VDAYRDTSAISGRLSDHAGYWLAWELGWLWFSAHRSLGDDVAPLDTHDRPADDVISKLSLLPHWLSQIESWETELSRSALSSPDPAHSNPSRRTRDRTD
jgi:hypothetical protein